MCCRRTFHKFTRRRPLLTTECKPSHVLDCTLDFWINEKSLPRFDGTRKVSTSDAGVAAGLRVGLGAARDEIDAIQESLAEEFPDDQRVSRRLIRTFWGRREGRSMPKPSEHPVRTLLIFFGASEGSECS